MSKFVSQVCGNCFHLSGWSGANMYLSSDLRTVGSGISFNQQSSFLHSGRRFFISFHIFAGVDECIRVSGWLWLYDSFNCISTFLVMQLSGLTVLDATAGLQFIFCSLRVLRASFAFAFVFWLDLDWVFGILCSRIYTILTKNFVWSKPWENYYPFIQRPDLG